MNTIFIATVITCLIIGFIVSKTLKSKQNKQIPDDKYNNFHLGEITSHDVKQTSKNKNKNRKGEKNGKESKSS